MAKILLTIIILLTLAFIVVAMYCACVLAGRSDDDSKENCCRGNCNRMFLERQICPRCETGKYTYELDRHSEICPYIHCWKRNKCSFYKPLDKNQKERTYNSEKRDDTV